MQSNHRFLTISVKLKKRVIFLKKRTHNAANYQRSPTKYLQTNYPEWEILSVSHSGQLTKGRKTTPHRIGLELKLNLKILNLLVESCLHLGKLIYRRQLGLNTEVELDLGLGA